MNYEFKKRVNKDQTELLQILTKKTGKPIIFLICFFFDVVESVQKVVSALSLFLCKITARGFAKKHLCRKLAHCLAAFLVQRRSFLVSDVF